MSSSLLLVLALNGCAARNQSMQIMKVPEETWDASDKDVVRLELVRALMSRGLYQDALTLISELRKSGASGDEIDLMQAECLIGLGLHTEAEQLLSRGMSRNPERYRLQGLSYLDQKRVDEAIEQFELALRFTPKRGADGQRALLHNNLGFALASDGQHLAAIDEFSQALLLDPSLTRARNNLGFSLAALGRDEEAFSVFRAVQESQTSSPLTSEANAYYNLGLARAARGDADGARQSLSRALELAPDHERARDALASLTEPNTPESP